ncbi:DNA polymerase III subunit gamma/tau [Flavobacteriaceae bacterium]|nr:DNA polymerase III subunit gamma/tau [Flavobacteriaceae bacterium]MDC0496813.1 DNA polymerase III subunit gamma/tau [Flavobacteriaceae bacterium]MDC0622737.1 DNA polymerase III subunit gamma/tau [Flavobacteriaceae bacterium]MDC1310761.1 DNA polymerase III subunit gamma/tau [Flavobacteriaceae bacterium]MDC1320866.1 DNA polymerase III subunit gamma/tau [Flavobacteriaceae bacterium]
MEDYIVSARKYRPKTFDEVAGQEAITSTLVNAITNNQLAQALLFTGPRGVGKTSCARILAKMINSSIDNDNQDFAYNIFELDAASNNSVDDIRNLTEQVRIPPQLGKYKVYIIDEVHMLSASAFNAFLKTLEEPPKHCIFILATTEKHKIIPTILSRCQIYDFKRITNKDIVDYLIKICNKEKVKFESEALDIIANKADGAMRDALSIFDRILSYNNKEITVKDVSINLNVLDQEIYSNTIDLILENKIPELLLLVDSVISKGFEGINYISGLSTYCRNLLISKDEKTILLLDYSDNSKQKIITQAKKISPSIIINCLELLNKCEISYRSSINQRLLIELTIMQLGSLTLSDQKKKSSFKIIPFEYFKNTTHITPISVPIKVKVEKPKLDIKTSGNSGLSLKSIKTIKNHEFKSNESIVHPEKLPKDEFTEEDLVLSWNKYSEKIENLGKYNLASILRIDKPKLEDYNICLELPNTTNKIELESNQHDLLKYIRKDLNNYDIKLKVTINEKIEKKFTYTPKEKYELLKSKNTLIEKLRLDFKLSI